MVTLRYRFSRLVPHRLMFCNKLAVKWRAPDKQTMSTPRYFFPPHPEKINKRTRILQGCPNYYRPHYRRQYTLIAIGRRYCVGNFFNMKCFMAGFSRPRTVTVRLTSCSYLYLCFCCRGSGDGERKTHQS